MGDNLYTDPMAVAVEKPRTLTLTQLTDEVMKLRAQVGDLRDEITELRCSSKMHETVLGQIGAYAAMNVQENR